jgi:hypothetical protein
MALHVSLEQSDMRNFVINELTRWWMGGSQILLNYFKEFPAFMEPYILLTCSQQHPEPAEPS